MERFSFASDVAFVPRGDLLDHVTIAPLTSPDAPRGHPSKRRSSTLRRVAGCVDIRRPARSSSRSWKAQEWSAAQTGSRSPLRPVKRSSGTRAKSRS